MKSQKGFTLVETFVVIAILVISVTVAVPQFQRMAQNGNLRAAAKDIMGDFANMRGRAMAENSSYAIVFDQANNSYTIPGQANPKTPSSFAGDIAITAVSATTLTFQTRGTITPPVEKTLTLTNGRGSTATITITTAGRIHVQYNFQ
jgi:prepilin-type N-terminal cleavage/methylation domain-containing protein